MLQAIFLLFMAAPIVQADDHIPVRAEYRHLSLYQLPTGPQELLFMATGIDGKETFEKLDNKKRQQILTVINNFKLSEDKLALEEWSHFLVGLKNSNYPLNINHLLTYIVREAFLEPNKDLLFYAEKTHHIRQSKSNSRSQLNLLRRYKLECERRQTKCSDETLLDIEKQMTLELEHLRNYSSQYTDQFVVLQNKIKVEQKYFDQLNHALLSMHSLTTSLISILK